MNRKRNGLIGLLGMVAVIVMAILAYQVFAATPMEKLIVLLGACILGLFFLGISFNNWKVGLALSIPPLLYALLLFFVPQQNQWPFLLAALLILSGFFWVWDKRKRPQAPPDDASQYFTRIDEAAIVFKNAIYLIEPNFWTRDVTFKVVAQNGELFFCKTGKALNEIDEIIARNGYITEAELLSGRKAVAIPFYKVAKVKISVKKRKQIQSVSLSGNVNHYFVIHPNNDYLQVEAFFKNVTPIPVILNITD